ncbi:MAG: hypothetical protein AABW49_03090 [Nanoarchaeota archaeon]
MKIYFFEEFPSVKSLSKLKFISWQSKLFLASKSYQEFNKWKIQFSQNNIEFVYWPILNIKNGYYLSPFVPTKVLKQQLKEYSRLNSVMWDAEFPKNRLLLFNPQFFRNKSLIKKFFKDYSKKVYTSEYFYSNKFLKFLGLNFQRYENKIIKMMYSSLHSSLKEVKHKEIKNLDKDRLIIGLGCIATGILGNEPIISPENLQEDLEFCKNNNIKEVVIFRLDGLNESFLKIIKKYT